MSSIKARIEQLEKVVNVAPPDDPPALLHFCGDTYLGGRTVSGKLVEMTDAEAAEVLARAREHRPAAPTEPGGVLCIILDDPDTPGFREVNGMED